MNSRSWILDDEGNRVRPWRHGGSILPPRPTTSSEALFSHPTGFAEVWHGCVTIADIQDARITRASLEMTTDTVMRTESAKRSIEPASLNGLVPDGDLAADVRHECGGRTFDQPPGRQTPTRVNDGFEARLRDGGYRRTDQRRDVWETVERLRRDPRPDRCAVARRRHPPSTEPSTSCSMWA